MKYFSPKHIGSIAVWGWLLCYAFCCQAENMRLADGTVLYDIKIRRITGRGMVVEHSEGVTNVKRQDLHSLELKKFAAEIKKLDSFDKNRKKMQRKARHDKRLQQLRANAEKWQELPLALFIGADSKADAFLQKKVLNKENKENNPAAVDLETEMDMLAGSFASAGQLRKMMDSCFDDEILKNAGILLDEAQKLSNQTVAAVIKKAEAAARSSNPEMLQAAHRYLHLTAKNFPEAENLANCKPVAEKLLTNFDTLKLRNVLAEIRDFADTPVLVQALADHPRASCRNQAEKKLAQLRQERIENARDPLSAHAGLTGFKKISTRQWRAGDAVQLLAELIAFIQQLDVTVAAEQGQISINWDKVPAKQQKFLQSLEKSILLLQQYDAGKRERLKNHGAKTASVEKEHQQLKAAFDAYNRAVLLFWSMDTVK